MVLVASLPLLGLLVLAAQGRINYTEIRGGKVSKVLPPICLRENKTHKPSRENNAVKKVKLEKVKCFPGIYLEIFLVLHGIYLILKLTIDMYA